MGVIKVDDNNPPPGGVRLEVEATPHDIGANGHHWSKGIYSAKDAAKELRDLADRIESQWGISDIECPWAGQEGHAPGIVAGLRPPKSRWQPLGDPGELAPPEAGEKDGPVPADSDDETGPPEASHG